MSKIFILIFISLITLNSNCNKISWNPTTKLKWSDFKGSIPEEKSLKTAVTFVQIEIEGEIYEDEIPNIQIVTYFLKDKSWTIVNDKETLVHEQLHFDIAELYARQIRKEFKILVQEECSNFKLYEKIYQEKVLQHGIMQREYDSKVYFNEKEQKQWQEKIAKELEELKEYEYISDNE